MYTFVPWWIKQAPYSTVHKCKHLIEVRQPDALAASWGEDARRNQHGPAFEPINPPVFHT
jgi:hypothetical protein